LNTKSSSKVGPAAIDAANATPINIPIVAIAFALCSSFTKSLIVAVTTAPIAPAPCKSLPNNKE
jgi:hypothetical protein